MKSGETLKIGNSWASEYLIGAIDEVWVFNSALSDGQVSSLYQYNNTAPTDIALSNVSVPENPLSGIAVGTLSTVDPDNSSSETFTYTLVNGTGSDDNSSFTIVDNTLYTAAPLDYDAKNSYSIRIRSTDQSGLAVEKEFQINVLDVTAPTVTNVLVRDSGWPSAFPFYNGYSIPVGSGSQLVSLPWIGINQIKVVFSEDVVVDQADLLLSGINTTVYDVQQRHIQL